MRPHLRSPVLALLALGSHLLASPVGAADAFFIEAGRSFTRDRDIDTQRVGIAWDWGRQWTLGNTWSARGHWETSLGHWRGGGWRGTHTTWDLGLAPVVRFWPTAPEGARPYLEAGVGLHWLNDQSFSDRLRTGSRYQFGLMLGGGVRFGQAGRYELGWRVRHLSNAGLRQPNPGANVGELRFQIHR